MAQHIIRTPTTPTSFLVNELSVFASRGDRQLAKRNQLAEGDESQNVPFILALCSSFQAKLLEYYNAGVDAQDRLERLAEISQTFRELRFQKGDDKIFTTASSNAEKTAEAAYALGAEGCPVGTTCVDRNCVQSGDGGGVGGDQPNQN